MVTLAGLALLLTLISYQVVGPGVVSYAEPGVLERVAERRLANGWGLKDVDLADYDLLGATADCDHIGRRGILKTEQGYDTILIVDCENGNHKGQMDERGLLVDVNNHDLVHQKGWLFLYGSR